MQLQRQAQAVIEAYHAAGKQVPFAIMSRMWELLPALEQKCKQQVNKPPELLQLRDICSQRRSAKVATLY